MSSAEGSEFRDYVAQLAAEKKSHYYYSAELPATPISADRAARRLTVRTVVSEAEISASGCIDEGLVATIADYWTSTLLSAVHAGKSSVTTSLSVQTPRPIPPGTPIDVVCTAMSDSDSGLDAMPYATAMFVAAADHLQVFAVATHTKFFKTLLK